MAIEEAADLYVSDNDFEQGGDRAITNDPDRGWRFRAARRLRNTMTAQERFDFLDICGDSLPAWHETHPPI